MRDNILSPDRVALVVDIMKGYNIDVSEILAREIYNRVVSTNSILDFPGS